jgi:uncharacterized membrane protein
MVGSAGFEAVIVPHRALSARGRRRLLCAIGGASLAIAGTCVAIGAWPVAGFAAVAVALATLALRRNAQAALASETLVLTEAGLRILRTDRRGARCERCLPASWLAVDLLDRPGRVPVLLVSAPGLREEVAASLGEGEKRDLATALRAALDAQRNPRFDNP